MQRLELSGAVRPIYGSLGVKRLINKYIEMHGQQNIKTLFLFNNFFFSKIVSFMKYVEKYCGPGESTDDNTAHAHCMLHT